MKSGAFLGGHCMVQRVDRGDGVGRVVKTVDELKSQSDEERDSQQDEGQEGPPVDRRQLGGEARADVEYADQQRRDEDEGSKAPGSLGELGIEGGSRRGGGGHRMLPVESRRCTGGIYTRSVAR